MEDKNVVLFVVYLNMVLYSTCYQIQRPLEPFLIDSLINETTTDSANEYARLQSFFSIMQTVGAVFTGYILDRIGIRVGFILSYAAAGISYHLLSQSKAMIILYISKIPTILQAGYLCGQLAVSQVTNDGPERLTALGRLTMSYTIGSIIGPTLGGYLGGKNAIN
jgi:MFS transporter, OCT family, solute carrier family 22 (organic cation transporter), member 18